MFTREKEVFVGRTDELRVFEQLLAEPKTALLSISGKGGMGKTMLLQRMLRRAREVQEKDRSLVVLDIFDFSRTRYQFLTLLILDIARQLRLDLRVGLVESPAATGLGRGLKPGDPFVERFFEEYASFAKDHHIVLFFDTFEILDAWAKFDFQYFFVPRLSNTLSVVAGREGSVGRPSVIPEERLKKLELCGLRQDEAREYLLQRGLSAKYIDDNDLQAMSKLYEGAIPPTILALAADWLFEHFDLHPILAKGKPRGKFEAELVRRIYSLRWPEKAIVSCMAYINRRFNRDLLGLLIDESLSNEAEEIFARLDRFSFVKYRPPDYCLLHDEMQRLTRKYYWPSEDPDGRFRKALSQSTLVYYDGQMKAIQDWLDYHESYVGTDRIGKAYQEEYDKDPDQAPRIAHQLLLGELAIELPSSVMPLLELVRQISIEDLLQLVRRELEFELAILDTEKHEYSWRADLITLLASLPTALQLGRIQEVRRRLKQLRLKQLGPLRDKRLGPYPDQYEKMIKTFLEEIEDYKGYYEDDPRSAKLFEELVDELQEELRDLRPMFSQRLDMPKATFDREQTVEALRQAGEQAQYEKKEELASQIHSLAGTYTNQGNFEAAIHYARQFCELAQELAAEGKPRLEPYLSRVYRILGRSYRSLGQWDTAETYYRRAFESAAALEKEKRLQDWAETYNEWANLYRLKGDFRKAAQLLSHSEEWREHIAGTESYGPFQARRDKGIGRNIRGHLYRDRGQIDEATECYREAGEIFSDLLDRFWLARVYANFGEVWYRDEGRVYRELESYNRHELVEQAKLYRRSDTQEGQRIREALAYLDYSATVFGSAEFYNPYELAIVLNRMAQIHIILRRYSPAESCLEKALVLSRKECRSTYLEADNLLTLVALYYLFNTPDSISAYQHRAIEAGVEKYPYLAGRLHLILGNIDFDEALRERREDRYTSAFTHYADACAHMLSHNYQRYEATLITVENRLRKLPTLSLLNEMCNLLITYWQDRELDNRDYDLVRRCYEFQATTHI